MTALSADDGRLIVRRAVEGDIPAIEALVDLNVRGHPAERHVRSREALHRAYFSDGPSPVCCWPAAGGRLSAWRNGR